MRRREESIGLTPGEFKDARGHTRAAGAEGGGVSSSGPPPSGKASIGAGGRDWRWLRSKARRRRREKATREWVGGRGGRDLSLSERGVGGRDQRRQLAALMELPCSECWITGESWWKHIAAHHHHHHRRRRRRRRNTHCGCINRRALALSSHFFVSDVYQAYADGALMSKWSCRG